MLYGIDSSFELAPLSSDLGRAAAPNLGISPRFDLYLDRDRASFTDVSILAPGG